jgi:hypothetical protein
MMALEISSEALLVEVNMNLLFLEMKTSVWVEKWKLNEMKYGAAVS